MWFGLFVTVLVLAALGALIGSVLVYRYVAHRTDTDPETGAGGQKRDLLDTCAPHTPASQPPPLLDTLPPNQAPCDYVAHTVNFGHERVLELWAPEQTESHWPQATASLSADSPSTTYRLYQDTQLFSEVVPEPCDRVLAQGALEAAPCLVRHLQQVGSVLNDGTYTVCASQSTYRDTGFTLLGDVLATYLSEQNDAAKLASVLEREVTPLVNEYPKAASDTLRECWHRYTSATPTPRSSLAWTFRDPHHQAQLLQQLFLLGLSPLRVTELHTSPTGASVPTDQTAALLVLQRPHQ